MPKKISFFCPAFNEEGNLEKFIYSVLPVLREVTNSFEIIIVDNGSQDNTPAIADNLAKKITGTRVIHHEFNREYGGALKSGFNNCQNDLVVYTDSDNQYDFNDFKKFLAFIDKFDVVIGYRLIRHDSAYRIFQSAIFNTIIKALFGLKLRDINCSFKLYRREVLDNIDIVSNSSFIDAEMLIKARNKGYAIFEIPVSHFPRKSGKASGAKPAAVLITLKEIFNFWFNLYILPAKRRLYDQRS